MLTEGVLVVHLSQMRPITIIKKQGRKQVRNKPFNKLMLHVIPRVLGHEMESKSDYILSR